MYSMVVIGTVTELISDPLLHVNLIIHDLSDLVGLHSDFISGFLYCRQIGNLGHVLYHLDLIHLSS